MTSTEQPDTAGTSGAGGTERVALTGEAAELIRRLTDQHGPVMFHQSGGCCDGSSPMCYPVGDFLVGDSDVRLGRVGVEGLDQAVDVWMSGAQFDYWKHTHLTIDVVPGRGGGFSLEAPEGVRFLIRSRLFTDDETAALTPVVTGAEARSEPWGEV